MPLQPNPNWGDQHEFDALDALRSQSMFQQGHTEHATWVGIDRLRDVSFNFAAFFDGLHRCYQDLLLGRVPMNSHFGRFLEYFADILGDGSLPDFYIVRVQALLESAKLLLPRLDGNRRSTCKARLRRIWSELELFKSDSFTILSDRCDRQAEEIKNLHARLLGMEAQLGATLCSPSSSSTPVTHARAPKQEGKSVKCYDCPSEQFVLYPGREAKSP